MFHCTKIWRKCTLTDGGVKTILLCPRRRVLIGRGLPGKREMSLLEQLQDRHGLWLVVTRKNSHTMYNLRAMRSKLLEGMFLDATIDCAN